MKTGIETEVRSILLMGGKKFESNFSTNFSAITSANRAVVQLCE